MRTEAVENKRADSVVAATGFDTTQLYKQPVCLQFHGHPILALGSQLAELDSTLSFHSDPNSGYNYSYPQITDYVSIDDTFFVSQKHGSANGIIFLSADRNGRIFRLRGDWLLDVDTSQQATQQALQAVFNRVFPCMTGKLPLLPGKKSILHGPQFDEVFELHLPDTTGFRKYSLTYSVQLAQ